jgi:hypothetical protein
VIFGCILLGEGVAEVKLNVDDILTEAVLFIFRSVRVN